MKTKSIIFSGAMVRAILDGSKTQFRKVIKPQPNSIRQAAYVGGLGIIDDHGYDIKCPYEIGMRLWVREAFGIEGDLVFYRADDEAPDSAPWKSPIYMPRHASRIMLEVTDIHAGRVQNITPQDAQKEGIKVYTGEDLSVPGAKKLDDVIYIDAFATLWDSINQKRGYGWDSNPYIFIYEFKVITTEGK